MVKFVTGTHLTKKKGERKQKAHRYSLLWRNEVVGPLKIFTLQRIISIHAFAFTSDVKEMNVFFLKKKKSENEEETTSYLKIEKLKLVFTLLISSTIRACLYIKHF